MRSESHASPMKAMFLAILMVMMVQTGYMDIWNNSVSNDSSLDETTPKESGASGNSLIPSSLGADLMVDEMMDDITFRYKEDYNGNGTAWMVKDIHDKNSLGNHPTLGHSGGHVTSLMTMNDILYFPAQDIEDNELWRSDGTESGTYMVKNIRSNYSYGTGPSYLNQSQPRSIVNYGNNIYFRALGDSGGFELWKSDGTESGTVMAKDIEPGPPGSNPYYLELAGDVIYMRARSSNYGEELYAFDISNGTSWLVKDINSGSADSGIDTIFAIGSSVYFSATDGIHGEELWKSDGTSSGTFMVKDINTGGALSNGSYPHDFATLDGNLFFVAYDGTSNAYAVWKSDGTASGTVILKNNSDNIKINGNYIHFKDGDGKLWRSDGTITETVLITDNHSVYDFYPTNDSIYIVERTLNPTIYSLWKFDKTNSGFKELVTGFSSMSQLFTIEDTLYFKGDDGTHGDELWRSDGTIAGTVLATDIANGSDGSNIGLNFEFANHNPWKAQKIGNTLYFTADDRVHDKELWAYDLGTNLASYEVTGSTCTISPTLPTGLNFDTGSCTISGTPSVVTSNTTYTVTANISGTDYQSTIWLSSAYRQLTPSAEGADLMVGNVMGDITFQYNASAASGSGSGSGSGSNSGTYNGNGTAWMVKDIRSGSSSSSPNYFTAVGNTLYFVTNDGTNGVELWKSDGTASGTVMVKDINSGGNSNPEYLTAVGNTVYFQADDGINGEELWKSDGTSAGTVMVKDIKSGSSSSSPNYFTAVGNTLYFTADDGINGEELWKSDGTASGTVMFKDIGSGFPPRFLTAVGNTVYFQANDGTNGSELWKSDGTTSGTVMVKDINTGGGQGSNPSQFTAVGNTLYFTAYEPTNGSELWKSDGTSAGTVMVKDIRSGSGSSTAVYPTAVGNTVYFRANDGTNGTELWKSDGTASGTLMVKDITSGSGSSTLAYFTAVGNTLFFRADDGTNGTELWKSDGTASGTLMVKDINSGSGSSTPAYFTAVGNTVYFQANDGTNGTELWKSDGTASGTVMVKDIKSGSYGSFPGSLTAVGNTHYFRASDGINGEELWALDPANITGLSGGSGSGSGGGMTNVTGATCTVSPALPTGMNLDTGTCAISGTPSVVTSNTTYTITADISGTIYQGTVWFSTGYGALYPSVEGAELNVGTMMTDITFEYDGTLSSGSGSGGSGSGGSGSGGSGGGSGSGSGGGSGGSNIFYGNNSTWSGSMTEMYSSSEYNSIVIGDTLYYTGTDSSYGIELHAFNFANMTSWLVDDIYTGSDSSQPNLWGNIGDTLFFRASDGNTGKELWAHNLSNQTSWNVVDMKPGSTSSSKGSFIGIIGDTIYFYSEWMEIGVANGAAIFAYSTTNLTHWEVADPSTNSGQNEGMWKSIIVGDDIYFGFKNYQNNVGFSSNLYVLNTTTESLTKITNHAANTDENLGRYVFEILGDILLYDYDDGNGLRLWAYNTSNSTTWKTGNAYPKYVTSSSTPSSHVSMNDVFYFGSTDGLYAYNTTNETQWRATKSTTNTWGDSNSKELIAVGDTIYFISLADDEYGNYLTEQLLAYDTSNDSTWLVTEIGNGGWDNGVTDTLAVLGDTFYFRGKDVGGVYELWAHDTSNCQTWNGISTSGGSSLWNYFDGTTLYYHWDDGTSDAIHAHQPAEIDNSTTTGCFMDGQTPGINPSEELQLAIVELASYEYTTCAITGNGSVACWGENFSNNFGGVHPDFDTPQPIPLPSGRTAVDISVGKHSACAILDNASVVCWGKGKNGHLGNNATYADAQNQAGDYYYNPVYTEPMPDGATPLALASAESSHCALLDNGKVACWGANGDGQLGIGQSYVVKPYPLLTDPFPEGQKAIMLSGSHDHYCVLMENLDVSCWGGQTLSEFTLGWLDEQGSPIDYNDATSPILGAAFNLGGLSNGKQGQSIRYVDVGFSGTCVILTNYSIACSAHISGTSTPWNGEAEHPFLVSNPTGQRPITLSGNCALLENLSIACWRHTTGDFQNHVNVTAPYTLTYSNMSEFGDIAALQKGYASHLCAITTSAQMVCAGDNRYGQLGQGSSGGSSGAGYVGGNWSFGPIFGGGSGGSGPARMLVTNATCSISPALPTGLSLTQGTCAITGTPFLGMANTTFTVTAVIENVTYAGEFWLNITGPLDPPMPLIAVNNTAIIDYGPYSALDGATYEISPDLPGDLVLNPTTGVISGTPRETLANTTFTIWANSSSENRTWNFTLEILEDTDGDGDPDQLPDDYDPGVSAPPMLTEDLDDDGDGISDLEEDADGTDPLNPDTDGDGMCDGAIAVDPHCFAGPDAFPTDPAGDTDTDGDGKPDTLNPPSNSVPPLEEDMDDDGDGVEDVNETDTGIYVDETDTGTNPLNPDTDYDGTCDGPVDVYHPQTGDLICVAGPDTELGNLAYGTHYGLNGSAIQSIRPEWRPAGAVWTISPDLPADLTIDPVSGLISGIPSEVTGNVTYTISGVGTSSTYSSQFNLQILEDTDRDGEANELPADYDNTTVTPMVEDLDDDGDGLSDLVETGTGLYNGTGDYGTDPLNPDTDGDGVCDGPNSVWPICINGPDSNPFGTHDASNIVLVENMAITTPIPPPNQVPGAVWEISPALPEGLTLNTSSGIITGTPTEVRDNETYTLWANVSDFGRSDSVALSVMATFGLTVLADTDGDGMPDELPDDYDENIGILVEDDDDDNDGMLDTEEATEGTNPLDPDTDGDGFCDGPADVYSSSGELICRGPDPAPLDANEPLDTDGDMFPDEDPDGEGGLVADADDDNDGFLDTLETSCGSSTVDATDTPQDYDGDTICDLMDPDMDGDGLNNTIETDTGIYIDSDNTGTNALNPDTDGDGYCDGPVSPNYSNCTAGPDAFPTDASAHLDTDGDGNPDTITGNSTTGLIEDLDDDGDGASDIAELDCGTDPLDATDVAETDSDGNCLKKIADPESLFEWNWGWCFCLVFLLLLLLLIPIVMQRDRILLMLADGPEPENTTSLPEFVSGAGTIDDPFILAPAEGIKPGESVSSTEVITIDKMSDIRVDMIDLNQEDNGNKFAMYETSFDEIGVRLVAVGSDGQITINFIFDDGEGEESYAGGEFTGLMKLGRASVYFSWTVTVTPDKAKMREIEKAEKEAKKAEEKAAKEAKKAEEKAAKEAEALAKKEAKEAEAAAKKAEEEAAALLAEEEAAAAAALAAKEEEEKAAKEAEAKAKKEAEAEAAALLAEEEAAAKKKAEEEAAAAALAAKEEEEKAAKEAEALAKEEAEAAAKKKAEEEASAAAAAAAAKPANKEEKKKAELKRVKERSKSIDFKVLGKAKASEKDDLQVIKGVGPFIEEKLNALGIYTYKQISKMTSKLEDTVNEAIEFFPGRVKRDQWVAQAKILLGEDVKLDEKALKQAEELARVAAKAESIDFATIGVASASEKDDLQTLKGIGPFIEEKLNALGIFKFEQIAKMTSEIEEEVNIAIEFFPGRVKRDEWVKQAKKLSKK